MAPRLNILLRRAQVLLTKQTDRTIARRTQQGTHSSSVVAVVDHQRLPRPADGALAPLRRVHRVVRLGVDAVARLEVGVALARAAVVGPLRFDSAAWA